MKKSPGTLGFAILFLILGITICTKAFKAPAPLMDAESMISAEITADNAYYFDNLAVIWNYAVGEEGLSKGNYYVAGFLDKEEQVCTLSVYFDNDEAWKEAAANHDFESDDMYISGCFTARSLVEYADDLYIYYKECFDDLAEGYLEGEDPQSLGLQLHYVCESKEDYAKEAKNTDFALLSLPMFAFCAFFLFLTIRAYRKPSVTEVPASYSTLQEEDTPYQGPEF